MPVVTIKIKTTRFGTPIGFADILFYYKKIDTPSKATFCGVWSSDDRGQIIRTLDLPAGVYKFMAVALSKETSKVYEIKDKDNQEVIFNLDLIV